MAALRGPANWAYGTFQALPAPVRAAGEAALRLKAEHEAKKLSAFGHSPRRLLIGPLNTAGQAQRWARAAEQIPGVEAKSLAVERRVRGFTGFGYDADWFLTRKVQLRGMRPHQERVLGLTHVLAESGLAVLDQPLDRTIIEDLPRLRAAGVEVGLLIHGSELRDLREHAALDPQSPFRAEWDERWERMHATVERTRRIVEEFGGPLFVSTPDMLAFVPGATLLPIVIDVDRFTAQPGGSGAQVLERDRPVVLHAPTNRRLKGTEAIERVLHRLEGEGLVTYRRLEGVPNHEMPAFLWDADIVIDQIVLGNPGVLLTESLAAGRVVVAHLTDVVRQRMSDADPQRGLPPVLEATPDSLEDVLREIVRDRTSHVDLAAQGPAWARRNHDGTRAASVLAEWLGVSAH